MGFYRHGSLFCFILFFKDSSVHPSVSSDAAGTFMWLVVVTLLTCWDKQGNPHWPDSLFFSLLSVLLKSPEPLEGKTEVYPKTWTYPQVPAVDVTSPLNLWICCWGSGCFVVGLSSKLCKCYGCTALWWYDEWIKSRLSGWGWIISTSVCPSLSISCVFSFNSVYCTTYLTKYSHIIGLHLLSRPVQSLTQPRIKRQEAKKTLLVLYSNT